MNQHVAALSKVDVCVDGIVCVCVWLCAAACAGPPVIGKQRIHRALTDVAEFLEDMVAQTLRGINAGWTRNEVRQCRKPQPSISGTS